MQKILKLILHLSLKLFCLPKPRQTFPLSFFMAVKNDLIHKNISKTAGGITIVCFQNLFRQSLNRSITWLELIF